MTASYTAAIAAQLSVFHARRVAGMPRCGWKVGLNVPEIQAKLGLERSLVGWLDGDRIFPSGAIIASPPGSLFHAEPELCLRLADSVDPGADRAVARAAIDVIAPALEIVDYAKPATSVADIIEHSMFHSACILGDWHGVPEQGAIDVSEKVRLRVGVRGAGPARADLVPRDPGEIVLLVARALVEAGERLLAGDLILSGSFTAKALPLAPGETATAELGAFGVVSCTAAL
jgi:2-keto-4-pentenoate hydratase